MSNRSYLHCVLKASDCTVCVVDVSRGDETTQAHVFTTRGYARLTATPGDGSFTLGEAIPIRIRQPQRLATPASGTQPRICSACWEPYSNSMLAAIGTCVVQLAENGDATVVAGHPHKGGDRDGVGLTARFTKLRNIFADGQGSIFIIDAGVLRRLQLPASWRSPPQPAAAAVSLQSGHSKESQQQQRQRRMGRGGKAAHGSLQAQAVQGVTVTTVPCSRLHGNLEYGGAYDPATRSLVLCTANGVYRLDMTGNVVGAGTGAGAGEAGVPEPVLVAGSDVDVEGDGEVASGEEVGDGTDEGEEEEEREEESEGGGSEETGSEDEDEDDDDDDDEDGVDDDDVEDGEGQASFSFITGVALDGKGCAWVLDRTPSYLVYVASERRVLRVDLGSGGAGGGAGAGAGAGAGGAGAVTCVVGDEQVAALKDCQHPVILRNGFLAMVSTCDCTVLLLDLKLTPPSHGSGGSNCESHTLGSDLGALLARQPDGSADVEVEVGGQVFAAHRIVLAARSPYFRQRLDPGAGFADAEGSRLSLPDADPGVFAAVLRYMYTDSAGAVPPELLQPVGELADRLLLPGLCAHVGQQLLGTVCPRSVVDLLLWSEQRRGSFGALLGGLKDWFLGHHAQGEGGWVLGKEDVLRLMREGPEELAMELLYNERPDVRGYKRKRGE